MLNMVLGLHFRSQCGLHSFFLLFLFPFLHFLSLPPIYLYPSYLLNPIKNIVSGWEPLDSFSSFPLCRWVRCVYLCLWSEARLSFLWSRMRGVFCDGDWHRSRSLSLSPWLFLPIWPPTVARDVVLAVVYLCLLSQLNLRLIHFSWPWACTLYPLLIGHLLHGTSVFRVNWCCCFSSVTIAYPSLCVEWKTFCGHSWLFISWAGPRCDLPVEKLK